MHTNTIKFYDFGFPLGKGSFGSIDGAFTYNYATDEITSIFVDIDVKQANRWRTEREELKPDNPLWPNIHDALLERYGSDIDHATPDHILARNQRNQDALRTISLAGVRAC